MDSAPTKEELVCQLLEDGWSRKAIARKLGIHRNTVSRMAMKAAAREYPPSISPASIPKDPEARLAALRDGWLGIAEKSQELMTEKPTATQHAIMGGIATQRALELHEKLGGSGLPETLPEDDEEKRRVVLAAWWRAARRGSTNAVRHLAEALGLKSAQEQNIELFFERPTTEEDPAPSAPPVPAKRPRS